ncbi:MAG: hypothetical protein NTX64_06545 [Elusimicrobia bacterium]|nr:hypothetical protein [Elusimicrobiota bacterium]
MADKSQGFRKWPRLNVGVRVAVALAGGSTPAVEAALEDCSIAGLGLAGDREAFGVLLAGKNKLDRFTLLIARGAGRWSLPVELSNWRDKGDVRRLGLRILNVAKMLQLIVAIGEDASSDAIDAMLNERLEISLDATLARSLPYVLIEYCSLTALGIIGDRQEFERFPSFKKLLGRFDLHMKCRTGHWKLAVELRSSRDEDENRYLGFRVLDVKTMGRFLQARQALVSGFSFRRLVRSVSRLLGV